MVYAYIRVSTDRQDVDNQRIGINRKASELNLEIDEWISDDGVSGIKEYKDRMLGGLMDKIQDGDVIIVSEVSRLARSVFMLFRIVEHCTQIIDATIYTCKENQVLKKNDLVSAIILSAYGTAAQIEREMIVKRTNEGLEKRRKDGVIFGRAVGSKNTKINEKHEQLFHKIKELYEKGVSKVSIQKILGISRKLMEYICKKYNYNIIRKPVTNIFVP
jgi:DNA invertase Pin-like site-specific DNA recombinase